MSCTFVYDKYFDNVAPSYIFATPNVFNALIRVKIKACQKREEGVKISKRRIRCKRAGIELYL